MAAEQPVLITLHFVMTRSPFSSANSPGLINGTYSVATTGHLWIHGIMKWSPHHHCWFPHADCPLLDKFPD